MIGLVHPRGSGAAGPDQQLSFSLLFGVRNFSRGGRAGEGVGSQPVRDQHIRAADK
jgi:hypothetical protein